MIEIFDPHAKDYDRWYDTPEDSDIFREELECLRLLKGAEPDRWLEAGVGPAAGFLGLLFRVNPV